MVSRPIRLIAAGVLATFALLPAAVCSKELPRRGFLGASAQPALGGQGEGIEIGEAFPGTPAEKAGLKGGDVLVKVGDREIATVQDFSQAFAATSAGQVIPVVVRRSGDEMALSVTMEERPREAYEGLDTIYDAVDVDGAAYRSIVLKPRIAGKLPALYYIQGYNCASIDFYTARPNPSRDFVEQVARQGFVVYRIEKSGMGDSEGDPCLEIGMNKELEGFQAGLAALKKYDFVDAESVFLFGHSMGGIVGPAIASHDRVKGIIVYGTGGKTWSEYLDVNNRRQMTLAQVGFVEQDDAIRMFQKFNNGLLVDKLSPPKIFEKYPELKGMTADLGVEDDRHIMGRHYTYWQEIYDIPLAREFRDANTRVLAAWGESDFVSTRADHEWVADVVNFYNPGKGEFVAIPHTDHGFWKYEDQAASFAAGMRGGEFNPEVVRIVTDWMRKTMTG